MNEDKQKILDLLLPVLQATRDLHDLTELEYFEDTPSKSHVTCTFGCDGCSCSGRRTVNTSADSGIAMIRDVLKALK